MTFSYRENSIWVNSHQMLINGKADNITKDDFIKVAERVGIKVSEAEKNIQQVKESVLKWDSFANAAGVSEVNAKQIKAFFRFAD